MIEDEKQYIPPDYSGHPGEDDEDIFQEIDEDEARIEKLLDEQEKFNEKLANEGREEIVYKPSPWNQQEVTMSSPFGNTGSSWGNNSNGKAPWEQNNQNNKPSWQQNSGSSWGSSSGGWSGSSWGQKKEDPKPVTTTITSGGGNRKKVVICDALDCLYESWESNGRPNILPRAIFDLKPKFEVWDKIASFNPQKIYVIFPAGELVPSFGNRESAEVALEYIAQSVSTYLRIPRRCCVILKQMQQGLPKEKTLMGAVKDWKNAADMVYIGICSGRWGLSSRDMDASHECGIDYIDMYNLLDGKYEYE